jgi:Protein of unknown function (DUF998)
MKTRALLSAGALAGPSFVITFLVAGATRPDYDPSRHPISSLALGDGGWLQTVNFAVAGVLSLALAGGVWSMRRLSTMDGWPRRVRAGAVLIALWGLGFLGTAIFPTDAVSGYPAGTPSIPAGTRDGMLHNLAALVGALALIIAFFVLAGGGRRWTAYSIGSAIVFIVAFGAASVGFGQATGLVDVAGVLQRVAVVAAWAWLAAVAVRGLRRIPT